MLEVTNLSKQFGERVAVDKLTLAVHRGEILGLVGRNGAGKTTTMRAIMGVLTADSGIVKWSGHEVTLDDRLRFGYMPEERGLYPQMRVLDQMVYFARLHEMDVTGAAEHARRWLNRLGLHERENDRVVALSHGNQQRVQLAVALVYDPDLLVLDEPFAGLDPSAVDALSDVLREQATQQRAILFSSHQLELVERLCDQIVIIDQGRLLASGTLAELRARVPQHLRVQVDTTTDWWSQLGGVRVLRAAANGITFDVQGGQASQQVLQHALAAGPVEYFGFESGGLSELYRELVPE